MAVIRPFRALRPRPDRAQSVASVPYDVVNTDEARALAEETRSVFSTSRVPRSICRPALTFTATWSIAKPSRISRS